MENAFFVKSFFNQIARREHQVQIPSIFKAAFDCAGTRAVNPQPAFMLKEDLKTKRFSPQQIVEKLHRSDVELDKGIAEVCCKIGDQAILSFGCWYIEWHTGASQRNPQSLIFP